MSKEEHNKPRQDLQPGELPKENYAEHLARVIEDADNSKALLQANYKALHGPLNSSKTASEGSLNEPEE